MEPLSLVNPAEPVYTRKVCNQSKRNFGYPSGRNIDSETSAGRLANYHAYMNKNLAEVKHYESVF
jgi:hypothetical protein